MSRFSKSSALLLLLVLLPGAAGQESHGLSDHHAFIAGLDEVPAGDFVSFQIDHLYFKWATVWYSARVWEGPSVSSFMVDEDNFARFKAGNPFEALPETSSGPSAEIGGLASSLPSGLYFLIITNGGGQQSLVKWEIFLEPRFQGDPGALSTGSPPIDFTVLIVIAAAVGGAAIALVAFRRFSRRR